MNGGTQDWYFKRMKDLKIEKTIYNDFIREITTKKNKVKWKKLENEIKKLNMKKNKKLKKLKKIKYQWGNKEKSRKSR